MILQQKNKDSGISDSYPESHPSVPNGIYPKTAEDPVIQDTTPQRRHGIFHMNASRVDKISRFIFPFLFVIFNVYYWLNY